jgi:ubiquitin carboxyl-terminal hydrolase L5
MKDDGSGEAFHFVAYLPFQGKVYELDGLQKGPIEIGSAGGDASGSDAGEEDGGGWLAVARQAIQDRMDREGAQKYNLMAVVQDKRVPLQKLIEAAPHNHEVAAKLADEQTKRERWKLENQRRRHNYVPLVVEVLKELAKKGMLANLASEAQERADARKEAAKTRKGT